MTRAKSPHSAAAFYHAAQAVLAVENAIEIKVVSIDPDVTGRTYTSLEPLRTYCDLRQPRSLWTLIDIENYATTLLAGIVGRQLRVEAAFGYTSRCTGQERLHRGYLAKVRRCDEYDTDRAFAIIFGWLEAKDGGRTMDSLERLWKRAQRALRTSTNLARLHRVIDLLEREGTVSGREVSDLIC